MEHIYFCSFPGIKEGVLLTQILLSGFWRLSRWTMLAMQFSAT